MIDEFATLGEMSSILHDIAVARGFDIKYHLVVQDLNQLEREYGKTWPTFTNNSFQRVFAVNDLTTTKHISEVCGVGTVESISKSWGNSRTQTSSSGKSTTESSGTSTPPGIFRFSTHTAGNSESLTSGHSYSTGYSSQRNHQPCAAPAPDRGRSPALGQGRPTHHHAWTSGDPKLAPAVLARVSCLAAIRAQGSAGHSRPRTEVMRLSGRISKNWRPSPFLIQPAERPLPPQPTPVLSLPRPPDPPLQWRLPLAVCAVIAALILTWWAIPSTPKW